MRKTKHFFNRKKKISLVNTERHKKTIEVKYKINYYNFGKTGFCGLFSSIRIADNSSCTSTMRTHEQNQVVWIFFQTVAKFTLYFTLRSESVFLF